MNAAIFIHAYAAAAARYNEASLAVFRELEAAHPSIDFDALYRASSRAMELHVSALEFASRVLRGSVTYEKAEASLIAKFPEFPEEVCRNALNAARTSTR